MALVIVGRGQNEDLGVYSSAEEVGEHGETAFVDVDERHVIVELVGRGNQRGEIVRLGGDCHVFCSLDQKSQPGAHDGLVGNEHHGDLRRRRFFRRLIPGS